MGLRLLPRLEVDNATFVVTDNQHRSTTVPHLSVTGTPDGPIVGQYHAMSRASWILMGKVAMGGIWAHEITMSADDVP